MDEILEFLSIIRSNRLNEKELISFVHEKRTSEKSLLQLARNMKSFLQHQTHISQDIDVSNLDAALSLTANIQVSTLKRKNLNVTENNCRTIKDLQEEKKFKSIEQNSQNSSLSSSPQLDQEESCSQTSKPTFSSFIVQLRSNTSTYVRNDISYVDLQNHLSNPLDCVHYYLSNFDEDKIYAFLRTVVSNQSIINVSSAYIVGGLLHKITMEKIAQDDPPQIFTYRCHAFFLACQRVGLKSTQAWIRVQLYIMASSFPRLLCWEKFSLNLFSNHRVEMSNYFASLTEEDLIYWKTQIISLSSPIEEEDFQQSFDRMVNQFNFNNE